MIIYVVTLTVENPRSVTHQPKLLVGYFTRNMTQVFIFRACLFIRRTPN